MDRKGFTLIELLAVIVLLGVVGGIATNSVAQSINKSKEKTETVFVKNLSKYIDEYINLNSNSFKETTSSRPLTKCNRRDTAGNCKSTSSATIYRVKINGSTTIYLKTLLDSDVITDNDLINPKNKKKCFTGNGPEIKLYKDTDYVYYYYVSLSSNSCSLGTSNRVISTLPSGLSAF